MGDTPNKIIAFEQGDLDPARVIDLFAELIKSGLAWRLQGSYGRAAFDMIESGLITRNGEITDAGRDLDGDPDDDLGEEIVTVYYY
jgi:hypothetical protein